MNKRGVSLGLLISPSSCDGNVKCKLWFSKMGRGGFNPICFLKGVRGGYFGFWFHDGVGSPRFFMVFSLPALVVLVSLI